MDIDLSCAVDNCTTIAGRGHAYCLGHVSIMRSYGTLTPTVKCFSCPTTFILKVERRARNGWHYCNECQELIVKYGHLVSTSRSHNMHHVTKVQYIKMLVAQNFSCAMPFCDETAESSLLQIDHDHDCCKQYSCGKCVRGLLCGKCNTAVGIYEINKNRLDEIANYIATYKVSA